MQLPVHPAAAQEEYQYEVAVDSDILDKYIPRLTARPWWKMRFTTVWPTGRADRDFWLSGRQRGHYRIRDDGAALADRARDINEVRGRAPEIKVLWCGM